MAYEGTHYGVLFENLITYCEQNPDAPGVRAARAVVRAYKNTNERGLDTLLVEQAPFPQDFGDFIDILEDNLLPEFLLCDESTGLMNALHELLFRGWQVAGTFEKKVDEFTTLRGLRMKKTEY